VRELGERVFPDESRRDGGSQRRIVERRLPSGFGRRLDRQLVGR
jgi:hypothetical protein